MKFLVQENLLPSKVFAENEPQHSFSNIKRSCYLERVQRHAWNSPGPFYWQLSTKWKISCLEQGWQAENNTRAGDVTQSAADVRPATGSSNRAERSHIFGGRTAL